MWLSRQAYSDLREQFTKAEAVRETLLAHNRALEVTLDWFRVRITQLEQERAALVQNYMGVTIPTPSIERKKTVEETLYHATPHFGDMGDGEAAAQGVSWDEHGILTFADKK